MGWDVVIIGSGFGGAMVAHRLVAAGARVLMLERGDWVARGAAAWRADASLAFTPAYARDIPYRCDAGGHGKTIGGYACVGGPSVYFGGVALRFRAADFTGDRDVVADSGARWPYDYAELAPWYDEAERLLGIAGDDRGDPTAPPRARPYDHAPAPLAAVSTQLRDAARARGLSPFHLPLAIDRARCIGCGTCDTFACAIEAKNDVATTLLRPLIARGLVLQPRTIAVRLEAERDRVTRLHVVRRDTGAREVICAPRFVLAAGALGSAHLVLASRLDELSPARGAIGRHLMRHANAIVMGLYRTPPERVFHKQLAIHDWYFGDGHGLGKLGGVQQMMTPPVELVRAHVPRPLRPLAGLVEHATGLLCIAEDQPRRENRVWVDWHIRDAYGLPQLVIEHAHSRRDERARDVLVGHARRLLAATGARLAVRHDVKTFSHALGTLRMGDVVDRDGRFRGTANLWITDGSTLPLSAGVNPSLTIAATALRAASSIA